MLLALMSFAREFAILARISMRKRRRRRSQTEIGEKLHGDARKDQDMLF